MAPGPQGLDRVAGVQIGGQAHVDDVHLRLGDQRAGVAVARDRAEIDPRALALYVASYHLFGLQPLGGHVGNGRQLDVLQTRVLRRVKPAHHAHSQDSYSNHKHPSCQDLRWSDLRFADLHEQTVADSSVCPFLYSRMMYRASCAAWRTQCSVSSGWVNISTTRKSS